MSNTAKDVTVAWSVRLFVCLSVAVTN